MDDMTRHREINAAILAAAHTFEDAANELVDYLEERADPAVRDVRKRCGYAYARIVDLQHDLDAPVAGAPSLEALSRLVETAYWKALATAPFDQIFERVAGSLVSAGVCSPNAGKVTRSVSTLSETFKSE